MAAKTIFRKLLWEHVSAGALSFDRAFELLTRIEKAQTRGQLEMIGDDLRRATGPGTHHTDIRAHPRFFSAMLVRLPTEDGGKWHFVQDIGQGGLAFGALRPVPLAAVSVEIADAETGDSYHCAGRIVWYDSERARAGLEFTEVDPRLKTRLLEWDALPGR